MSWEGEEEEEEDLGGVGDNGRRGGGKAPAAFSLCTCAPVGVDDDDVDGNVNNAATTAFASSSPSTPPSRNPSDAVRPSTSIELDEAGPSAVGLSPFAAK